MAGSICQTVSKSHPTKLDSDLITGTYDWSGRVALFDRAAPLSSDQTPDAVSPRPSSAPLNEATPSPIVANGGSSSDTSTLLPSA
jgi:hypothetical protein